MVVGDLVNETEVLVIGGGPGGYTAAIRLGQLGMNVTLVEKNSLGGVCLNEGCIPSKALISKANEYYKLGKLEEQGIEISSCKFDLQKFQNWKNNHVISKLTDGISVLCEKNNVEVISGEAYLIDHNQARIMTEFGSKRYSFQYCIIATGSTPMELPEIKFGNRVLSSTEALSLSTVPEKMIIVGGGYIGIELGTAFAKLGTKIIILEAAEEILSGVGKDAINLLKRNLKTLEVDIYTNAKINRSEVFSDKVILQARINNAEDKIFEADYCLVTAGRSPNTKDIGLENAGVAVNEKGLITIDDQCRTSNSKIFAIGDVVNGPPLAHKAAYEGKIAAEVIAGYDRAIDYISIPTVIFSDPEISSVGLTEEQAKNSGQKVKIGKFPFSANGKALSDSESNGFVKVIACENNNLLGVQIVGNGASNIISEAALALEFNANVEDISLTIHPHPTLAEAFMESCDALLKKAIHVVN